MKPSYHSKPLQGTSEELLATEAKEQVKLLLTIRETALLLGCHKASVYRLVYRGKLPICRAFNSIRIPRKEVDRLVADTKVYDSR